MCPQIKAQLDNQVELFHALIAAREGIYRIDVLGCSWGGGSSRSRVVQPQENVTNYAKISYLEQMLMTTKILIIIMMRVLSRMKMQNQRRCLMNCLVMALKQIHRNVAENVKSLQFCCNKLQNGMNFYWIHAKVALTMIGHHSATQHVVRTSEMSLQFHVLKFLKLFLTDAIINTFVDNTNAYAANMRRIGWTVLTYDKLWRFIAITLLMGVF